MWNTNKIQSYSTIKQITWWYTLQCGWMLSIACYVKEHNHQILHSAVFRNKKFAEYANRVRNYIRYCLCLVVCNFIWQFFEISSHTLHPTTVYSPSIPPNAPPPLYPRSTSPSFPLKNQKSRINCNNGTTLWMFKDNFNR